MAPNIKGRNTLPQQGEMGESFANDSARFTLSIQGGSQGNTRRTRLRDYAAHSRRIFRRSKSNKTEAETVVDLRNAMENLRPTETSWHNKPKVFIHGELQTTSHVFVRNDAVRRSLSHPYEGPFEVIERTAKYFRLRMRQREVNISIDRLKPAFIANESLQQNIESTQTLQDTKSDHPATRTDSNISTKVTGSGRRIRFAKIK